MYYRCVVGSAVMNEREQANRSSRRYIYKSRGCYKATAIAIAVLRNMRPTRS